MSYFRVMGVVRADGKWAIVAYHKEKGKWRRWGVVPERGAGLSPRFPHEAKKLTRSITRLGWQVVWTEGLDPDKIEGHNDFLEALGFERLEANGADAGVNAAMEAVIKAWKEAKQKAGL